MKQTSVEWMIKRLENFNLIKDENIENILFKQIELDAKEIEHEKLQEAYNMGRIGKSIKEFNETFKQQEQIKTAKELIGKHVTAIGLYGVWKGKEVFGILSEDKGDWIVNIIDEDGFEMPCSVFYQTIKEA